MAMDETEKKLGESGIKMYFFGCVDVAGHYMHDANMRTDWKFMRNNPWGTSIDGGLAPRNGSIGLAQKNGWTAIAFNDYVGDSRPGSNSAFLAYGQFTIDQMRELAKLQFPSLANRIPGREIVLPKGEKE